MGIHRTRAYRALAAVIVSLLLAGPWAAARAADPAAFIPGTEDLPLMPGLTVVGEGGMVFDTPGGRIIEAYATGNLAKGAVLRFYRDTLPQLGWVRLAVGRHRREAEILKIDFPKAENTSPKSTRITARFTLKPITAK